MTYAILWIGGKVGVESALVEILVGEGRGLSGKNYWNNNYWI